jgi:hypothetical protein
MIIPTHQIGEVAKDGQIVEKQYKAFNTDTVDFCWLHNLTLTSDWKNPNEEDKKKLEKVRLEPCEVTERDGSVTKFRRCIKCGQIVRWTNTP